MKKIAWLCIILTIFSYTLPLRARAAAPALGLFGVAAIGATVMAIGGTQYAQKQGGSYSFNGSHLTREMIAYSNSKLTQQTLGQLAVAQGMMQDAGGYVLGKSTAAVFDLKKAYAEKVFPQYQALKGVIENYFYDNSVSSGIHPNDVFEYKTLDENTTCTGVAKVTHVQSNYGGCIPASRFGSGYFSGCGMYLWASKRIPESACMAGTTPGFFGYNNTAILVSTTDAPTYPDTLTPDQEKAIGQAVADAIATNPAVANDLDNLMKDHPELWAFPDSATVAPPSGQISDYPPVWPITPSQVQQWVANSSITAQQALIDDLQLKVNANPNDLALQTALSQAKAKLKQMQATSVGDLVQSEQLEAEKAKDLEITEPAVLDPELKSINLDPIKATQGVMMGKFPFSMLASAGSIFSALSTSPVAPAFDIDLGLTVKRVDLSFLDGFASNIRSVMAFLVYVLCVYGCLRIWSRF